MNNQLWILWLFQINESIPQLNLDESSRNATNLEESSVGEYKVANGQVISPIVRRGAPPSTPLDTKPLSPIDQTTTDPVIDFIGKHNCFAEYSKAS